MRRELLDHYRGRWVAVDSNGDVVEHAADLGELLRALERNGGGADLTVQRIPEADAPLFAGLG